MCHEDGRHAGEDGRRGDEDGRHVVKEVNLFWNIQACGNIRLLQTILREFSFLIMSVFLLFSNKESPLFCFLPIFFYLLFINSGLKEENVKHELSGISFQIEKRPNKGYCLFF